MYQRSVLTIGFCISLLALIHPTTVRGLEPTGDGPRGSHPVRVDAAAVRLDRVAREWASSAAPTTALNLSVRSGGANDVVVAPGGAVSYEVIGLLSDDRNEGLALFGFDLIFDGGPLPHANIPTGVPAPGCDHPMIYFTRPWGITNPDSPCPPACGFGGTIIGGVLVQVGGGQNTIRNVRENAPFPIGPVLPGVAQPGGCGPGVLVTGSFIAPSAPGTYTLMLRNQFANVIREGQTGDPFWASEAASPGAIDDLVVVVEQPVRVPTLVRGEAQVRLPAALLTEPVPAEAPVATIRNEEAKQRDGATGSTAMPPEAPVYTNFSEGLNSLLAFFLNWGPTTSSVTTNAFGDEIPNVIQGVWEADNATLGGGWTPGTPISSYELHVYRSPLDPLGASSPPAVMITELWDGDPLAEYDSAPQGYNNNPIAGGACTFLVPQGLRTVLRCELATPVVPPHGRVWVVLRGSGTCRLGWTIAQTMPSIGSDAPADVLQFQSNDDNAATDGFCCDSGLPCGPGAASPFCAGDPTGSRQYCDDDDAETGGSFSFGGPCSDWDWPSANCANFWLNVYSPTRTTMSLVPVSGEGNIGIRGNEIFYNPGGGRVVLELKIGDWDPDDTGVRLIGYQAFPEVSGFTSAAEGPLTFTKIPCASTADCIAALGGYCSYTGVPCTGGYGQAGSTCTIPGEKCVGTGCGMWDRYCFGGPGSQESAACVPLYQVEERHDFVLYGAYPAIVEDLFCYDWGGDGHGAVFDDPVPFPPDGLYGGTLLLDVSNDALGTFTVSLRPPPSARLIDDQYQLIPLLGVVPAKITVLDCTGPDCQPNGLPDDCDLATGASQDCDGNGIPDECEPDLDLDGRIDVCDACPEDPNNDQDGDGVCAPADECPADPTKLEPAICGCGVPETDTDHDGLPNCIDPCPSHPDNDGDGDGVCPPGDRCPTDPTKLAPGVCGCGVPDADADGDGRLDCIDPCPQDPSNDGDGDGLCAPLDQCPSDPAKTQPGQCGCGASDVDSDNDGFADCRDACAGFPDDLPGGCPLPTVSQWGLVATLLLLLTAARVVFRRSPSRVG